MNYLTCKENKTTAGGAGVFFVLLPISLLTPTHCGREQCCSRFGWKPSHRITAPCDVWGKSGNFQAEKGPVCTFGACPKADKWIKCLCCDNGWALCLLSFPTPLAFSSGSLFISALLNFPSSLTFSYCMDSVSHSGLEMGQSCRNEHTASSWSRDRSLTEARFSIAMASCYEWYRSVSTRRIPAIISTTQHQTNAISK
jgi:hypothetical protein